MVCTGDDCGVGIGIHLNVLISHERGVVTGVRDVSQKLGLVHHRAVGIGINEIVSHQAIERAGIMVQLGLIPGIL